MLTPRIRRARSLRVLSLALPLSLAVLSACADATSDDADAPDAIADEGAEADRVLRAEATAAAPSLPNFARGTREVLVEGIVSAENSLFTSSGKLLISGDEGIYDLRRDAGGRISANNVRAGEPCKFGGMAQLGSYVYANCYADKSALYAAPEATLAFTKIADIAGTTLANGLAADPATRALYVTATTEGKLFKLTVSASDPRKIDKQETVRSGLFFPNGLDIYGGYLYYGEYLLTGTIRRVPLSNVRGAPTLLVKQAVSFLDDFHVDDAGFLVADFLLDTLRAYDPRGSKVSQSGASYKGPSSVQRARGRLGLGPNDVIVTEKAANLVSVFRPRE